MSKYEIRVIRERANCDDHLFTYTGETHPQCGDRVEFADESYLVNGVRHVLRFGCNGAESYYKQLDHVEVKVY